MHGVTLYHATAKTFLAVLTRRNRAKEGDPHPGQTPATPTRTPTPPAPPSRTQTGRRWLRGRTVRLPSSGSHQDVPVIIVKAPVSARFLSDLSRDTWPAPRRQQSVDLRFCPYSCMDPVTKYSSREVARSRLCGSFNASGRPFGRRTSQCSRWSRHDRFVTSTLARSSGLVRAGRSLINWHDSGLSSAFALAAPDEREHCCASTFRRARS